MKKHGIIKMLQNKYLKTMYINSIIVCVSQYCKTIYDYLRFLLLVLLDSY